MLVAVGGEGAEGFFLGYALVDFDDEGRECFWGKEEFLVVWDFTEITNCEVSMLPFEFFSIFLGRWE